jgi:hypothetical protein
VLLEKLLSAPPFPAGCAPQALVTEGYSDGCCDPTTAPASKPPARNGALVMIGMEWNDFMLLSLLVIALAILAAVLYR